MRDPAILKALRAKRSQDSAVQLEQMVRKSAEPLTTADMHVALATLHISHADYARALEQCDAARRLLSGSEFGSVHAHEEHNRGLAVEPDRQHGRALQLLPFLLRDARWEAVFDNLSEVTANLRDDGDYDRVCLYTTLQLGTACLARWSPGRRWIARAQMLYEAERYEWSEHVARYVLWLGDQIGSLKSPYVTVPTREIVGDASLLRGDVKQAEEQYKAALEETRFAFDGNPRPYSESVQRLPKKLADLQASGPSAQQRTISDGRPSIDQDLRERELDRANSLDDVALERVRNALLVSSRWKEAARAASLLAERKLEQTNLDSAREAIAIAVGTTELAFDAGQSAAMMAALAYAELSAGNAWYAVECFQSAISRCVSARYPGYESAYVRYEEGFGDALFAAQEYGEALSSYERAIEQSARLHEPEAHLDKLREKLMRAREAATVAG